MSDAKGCDEITLRRHQFKLFDEFNQIGSAYHLIVFLLSIKSEETLGHSAGPCAVTFVACKYLLVELEVSFDKMSVPKQVRG